MRNLFKKFGFQGLVAAATLAAPAAAFAVDKIPSTITDPSGFIKLICDIADWMFTFIVVFAVIAILVAGFRYVTANGDAEAVEGANKALVFAAAAVAIAVVSKAIPLVVVGLTSSNGKATGCNS